MCQTNDAAGFMTSEEFHSTWNAESHAITILLVPTVGS
jgi:hypothetical protein